MDITKINVNNPIAATQLDLQKEIITDCRKRYGTGDLNRKDGGKIEWILGRLFVDCEKELESIVLSTIREVEARKQYHVKRWDQEDLMDTIRGETFDYGQ